METLTLGEMFDDKPVADRSMMMTQKPKIEKRVTELEQRSDDYDTRLSHHDEIIDKLNSDMEELKEDIKLSAKASDITALREHIDRQTIMLLKDALAAVPQKAMVLWMAIAAGIAACSILLPWAFRHFGL